MRTQLVAVRVPQGRRRLVSWGSENSACVLLSAEVIVRTPGQNGWGRGWEGMTVEEGPKTLGAKRETRGERAASRPPPPRWSQEECQGGDSSPEVLGSLAFYRRSLPELSGEPTAIVAAVPRAAAVTLHPAPQ